MSALKWGADYHGARICRKTRSQHNLLVKSHANLLAALSELVEYDEGSSEEGSYGSEVMERCRAAIAKAEGKP